MAKYSDIKGFTVQTLSSDTVASQIAGGSWSSGGNLPGPRDETTGAGTLTAGIQFGGYSPPESAYKPETFEYNGTAWTEGGDMSNARSNFGGLGTQTAALAIGGQNPAITANVTEEYDGSSWTAGGTLPTPLVSNYGATGTQTAGLMIGGFSPATPGAHAETLVYNGSSWSDTGHDVPATLDRNGATGTSTAAMTGGGRAPSATNAFNIYNGSSWTSITNYPTSGYHFQLQGPYTDTIVSGGYPLNTNSNWWDGTSWTSAPSMSNNHGQAAKANSTAGATSGDGFVAGADPSSLNGTEHWNSAPPVFTKQVEGQLFFNSTANAFKETITDFPGGTWASNTAAPTASTERWGTGTSNSNAMIGSPPGAAMEWNGSSWTNGGTVNDTFSSRGATGSITLALIWGGDGSPARVDTEQYNGSAWTEVNDLNNGGGQMTSGPTGTYTDTITAGRGTSNWQTNSEKWDGTSWTETAELNTARRACGAGGASSTNSLVAGGNVPPNNATDVTESWDGTSWTETGDLNTARFAVTGFGNVSTAVGITGGSSYPASPPYNTKTEFFNGTTWTEVNDLSNGRYHNKGGGSGASALTMGGYLASPAGGQSTENLIWEADLANKTITSS